MKIYTVLLFPIFAAIPHFSLFAEPVSIDSEISSVSLFRDGARVTRVSSFDAPAGKSTYHLENLPSSTDFSTIQASIGDAKGVIRNAKLFHPQNPEEPDAVKAIRERLEEHLRGTRKIKAEKAIAKDRIAFVEKMSESFADQFGTFGDDGSTLTIEQGTETWELVDQTRREAREAIEDADQKLRERSETEKKIKEELRLAVETATKTRAVAEVEIDLDNAQPIELSVSYQVFEARWQPRYELRANPSEASLDLGYIASVWQFTGEDWSDVELSLHTNQANAQGNVPELHAMHLQQDKDISFIAEKRRMPSRNDLRMTAASEAYMVDAADMAGAPPPSEREISVSASAVSFQATLPSPVTVPSLRDASSLPITEHSIVADFWSETVPKLQLRAYLRSKITNQLEIPILPGEALAFVDGELSSRVWLQKTLPGEEVELSLGADPNIVVKRIEGSQKDTNTGFIDKTVTLRRLYTNKITSYHSVAHKVVIVDQFPIATDDKIEIERIAPKESEVVIEEDDKDSGVFQWETLLQPEQSKSFVTEYKVEHPRDWDIFPTP